MQTSGGKDLNFLKKAESEWPENKIASEGLSEMKTEMRRNASTMCTVANLTETTQGETTETLPEKNQCEDKLNPERYSSWVRLVRVQAWVNRFQTKLSVAT